MPSTATTTLPSAPQASENRTDPGTPPSYLADTFVNIIDGRGVSSPSEYNVINPSTRKSIGRAPEATAEQLDEAVSAARGAFPGWRTKSWDERRAALRSIAAVIEDGEFSAQLAKMMSLEMGKPIWLSNLEVGMCASWIKGSLEMSLDETTLIIENAKTKVYNRHVPIGVTAGIIPWNFPLLMLTWKLVPALLTGNVLILKPSPFSPLAPLTFVAKIQNLLPPGVLSILSGGNELGKWITNHPGIDKIAFTGSIATGKNVLKSSAGTLKRVTLELGGNDPCIILPDAEPAKVAPAVLMAAFTNTGQICTAPKRLYVHESIYDEFVATFVGCAANMKVGDPLDPATMMGPVCNANQYEIVCGIINDCKKNGYKIAFGGEVDPNASGYFIPLTIIDNPPDDSTVVKEEPFGPVVPILKWKEEADVIRRANDTKCGLGASVWGKDLDAMQRIASQLEAGTVWFNDSSNYIPTQPFAGHKESGFGVENGTEGLKDWCLVQTFSINKAAAV